MKKPAFGYAAVDGFEMPSINKLELEKENTNIMYVKKTPKTVYRGSKSKFTRTEILAAALEQDLEQKS